MTANRLKIIAIIIFFTAIISTLTYIGYTSKVTPPEVPKLSLTQSTKSDFIEILPPTKIDQYLSTTESTQPAKNDFKYNILKINRYDYTETYFTTLIQKFPEIETRFKQNQNLDSQILVQENGKDNFKLQPVNVTDLVQIKVDAQDKWLVVENTNNIYISDPDYVNKVNINISSLNLLSIVNFKEVNDSTSSKVLLTFRSDDYLIGNNKDYDLAVFDFSKKTTNSDFIKKTTLTGFAKQIENVDSSTGDKIVNSITNLVTSNLNQNSNTGTDEDYTITPEWKAHILPSGVILISSSYQTHKLWRVGITFQTDSGTDYSGNTDVILVKDFSAESPYPLMTCSRKKDMCWVLNTKNKQIIQIDLQKTTTLVTKIAITNKDITEEKVNEIREKSYTGDIFKLCISEQALCLNNRSDETIVYRF